MEGLAGALRDAAQAPRRVAVPPLRGAKYRNHSVDVLAMEFSGDGATRLCIAWPDQAPMWVDANAVWFAGTGAA